jgi:acetyl-CoA C-acetyltransferase
VRFPWPHVFSQLGDEYERRYGHDDRHLARIAEVNFGNAKRNPNAQTRRWTFTDRSFAQDDEANPVIEGRIRKQDCGQITDGAPSCSSHHPRVRRNTRACGFAAGGTAWIRGWGHRQPQLRMRPKSGPAPTMPYVFPQVRRAITDTFRRAGIGGVDDLDGIETHDCFTTTEYMAIDHFGITPPGESWRAIEAGDIERGGRIPVNPSGGLLGAGHPVGATGVRMTLDCWKQVAGDAGEYQVEGARTFATLNIGGSSTRS